MQIHKISLVLGLLAISATQSALAADSIVYVRENCANAPGMCFTDTLALTTWLWNTRKPTETDPVAVEVGPGVFDPFDCPSANPANGYVRVRGTGTNTTAFENFAGGSAISIDSCEELAFQNLSVRSNGIAIQRQGLGDSTWIEVQVNGVIAAFRESPCSAGEEPLHHWFSSRLSSSAGSTFANGTFVARCGRHHFYGSELTTTISTESANSTLNVVHLNKAEADVRLYGSVVRATITDGTNVQLDGIRGIYVANGQAHMHGGIISIGAADSSQNYDAIGIETVSGSAYTPETAFNVQSAGSGNSVRLRGASIQAPYTWPAGTDVPATLQSTDGSDMVVETDCRDTDNNCSTGTTTGGKPHLMIYTENCTGNGGSWFDVATNDCRQ